jgi:hypothetical protein
MKLKLFSTLTVFITLIAALTGCISIPRQEFSKSANQGIKKIALVPPSEPRELSVTNLGGAGSAFGLIGAAIAAGLIGAAIAAADQESKSSDFTQQMWRQKLEAGKRLAQTVEAQLKSEGYDVTLLSGQRPVAIDEVESEFDYSRIKTDADAILHIWFAGVGYISPGGSPDYVPQVAVRARLLAVSTRSQLYYQAFMYGWNPNVENIAHLPAPGKYAYGDFETLMASSNEAAEGLQQGAWEIGARIGKELR